MIKNQFTKLKLNISTIYNDQIFKKASESITFDNITNERQGVNIVDYRNGLIPIVRTTSNYQNPNQKFQPIHYQIIEDLELNNTLIEIYDSRYHKMGNSIFIYT